MRYFILVLFAVAFACFAFAYWGLETPGGKRVYDEMAGIIPMAAGWAGVVFLAVAVALWFWKGFKQTQP